MKLNYLTILFTIMAVILFVISDVKTNNYKATAQEKIKLDQYFGNAIDDAAVSLIDSDQDDLVINKQKAVDAFYYSIYAAMDITDNLDKQELLINYTPVIAVTCEDGYYLYFSDRFKDSNNETCINKRWSEKIPYSYEDNDFIYRFTLGDTLTLYDKNKLLDTTGEQVLFTLDYHDLSESEDYEYFRSERPDSFLLNDDKFNQVRKGCIIKDLETSLSYGCNKHNEIAKQYGITYNFAIPVIDNSEWVRSIDEPCIIVIFQGYPFGNGLDTYNRYAIAGADVSKTQTYYIERKGWYYLYHTADCPELKKEGIELLEEAFHSILDCAEAGAYACTKCSGKTGVCAPDYAVK